MPDEKLKAVFVLLGIRTLGKAMLFKKANWQTYDMDVSKAPLMILGSSADTESILSQFTSDEIGIMTQWAREQKAADGAINLVRWPGWQRACECLHLDAGRAREIAEALLARLAGPSTL